MFPIFAEEGSTGDIVTSITRNHVSGLENQHREQIGALYQKERRPGMTDLDDWLYWHDMKMKAIGLFLGIIVGWIIAKGGQ
jgi:hypothetical protein